MIKTFFIDNTGICHKNKSKKPVDAKPFFKNRRNSVRGEW